jgi:hypothetical protein
MPINCMMLIVSILHIIKYIPLTNKGYSFFEVSSALQKTIRRGHEKEALYWGWELELSNYGKYFWKRMTIISVEDIGAATPGKHRTPIELAAAIVPLSYRSTTATILRFNLWVSFNSFHNSFCEEKRPMPVLASPSPRSTPPDSPD